MNDTVKIVARNHLKTLENCGGYYACPKGPDGSRLGPLVGYAGKYTAADGTQKQFVGDIYANFAKAEVYSHVLEFFAECLAERLEEQAVMADVGAFCGAPIGGYSLADALGRACRIKAIKAEKKITALATEWQREKSKLVFGRHNVEPGFNYVIVEDVCNNFSTTAELIALIRSAGGNVLAIVCFLNRSLDVNDIYLYGMEAKAEPLQIPVISLVRLPIKEWKQDDPAVADDIAKGNVVWKPKDEWDRLMKAMHNRT